MAASGTVKAVSTTDLDSIDLTSATGYDGLMMCLHDEYESDGDTLVSSVARPVAAYTSSPYIFERQPALPPLHQELTPPPSPLQKAASPLKPSTPGSYFGAANGLLTRASSVLGSRSKASSPSRSPTRVPQQPAHLQFQEPPAATVSSGRASPASASSPTIKHKSKGSFADLFQVQGLSAPLSLGLVTSPSQETPPTRVGSPHKHSRSESMAPSPTSARPGNLPRSSTFASLLGFAPQRPKSASPSRRPPLPIDEDDAILSLDVDDELYHGEDASLPDEAVDILSNSKKLFSRVHKAYRAKCQQLAEAQASRLEVLEDLTEEKTRGEHLKKQLDDLAKQMTVKDDEIAGLQEEIDERDRRARSVRLLNFEEHASLSELTDRERYFSMGLESEAETSEDSASVFDRRDSHSRPGSRSTAPTEPDNASQQGRPSRPRGSLAWAEAAPFVKPESKLAEENEFLKRRLAELEETLDGCLGLVGTGD